MPPKKQVADQMKMSYNAVFRSAHGETVLDDLITFSGMREPVTTIDPMALAIKEGRRDIVMRILERMNMNNIELANKIFEGED